VHAHNQLNFLEPAESRSPENRLQLTLDLDSARNKGYLTHNFHPYSAKFIPQIPRAILNAYAEPGSTVLDPFCGSGTVAVEALLRGHRCLVSDLNPIAVLITRAKVCQITSEDEREINGLLLKLRTDLSGNRRSLPTFKNISHWFTPRMIEELSCIKDAILELTPESAAQLLALTAFSAIIVKCSRQESETRWVAVTKHHSHRFAFSCFEQKLVDMSRRARALRDLAQGNVDVFQANANSLQHAPNQSIDIVITSPPYLNSYDYYLYHKLRMFWLDYNHYAVQEQEIGSRHRHCDKNESVESYVSAMAGCFLEIARVLKPNGILAIVIGDSIYKGLLIDMSEIYQNLALATAFRLVERFDYDQRKYTLAFTRGYKTIPKKTHILVFQGR